VKTPIYIAGTGTTALGFTPGQSGQAESCRREKRPSAGIILTE